MVHLEQHDPSTDSAGSLMLGGGQGSVQGDDTHAEGWTPAVPV